jgi:SpoVK/Ycf46/Vps4 family AAA+-type ATPase
MLDGASKQEQLLFELLAGVATVGITFLCMQPLWKLLDPQRAQREAAAKAKREIARRLGRPNIQTNAYEDIIACDVANPHQITTTFDSIGGLGKTKKELYDLVILPLRRPELFSGNLLKPVKGCMLYGPPGTGKTLLAKALAKECQACFINVRTSTLQSKWFGDANKLVSAVFSLAWKLQPSIIFIDEVDSFLGARKGNEHEANTSMKTEFMTMWDGFQTNEHARVMVLAATNRPWEVDEAILRRLPRTFEVGLPDAANRANILAVILRDEHVAPGFFGPGPNAPIYKIARATEQYSGSDLKELCKAAAYGPIRDLIEEEDRLEKRRAMRAVASRISSGVDDLDGDDDDFADARASFEGGPGAAFAPRRAVKRAMTLADFEEILGKGSTTAEVASTYRQAEMDRHVQREARAFNRVNGSATGGDAFARGSGGNGGGGGGGGREVAVTPEMLQAFMTKFMRDVTDAIETDAAAGNGNGNAGEETPAVTPELLTKMAEMFMLERGGRTDGA